MSADFFGRSSGNSGGPSQVGATLRPQPPLAKRLNRNALTVAAVIMGMTVLTAIVVLNPGADEKRLGPGPASLDEPPPVPPRPAFLDEPAKVPLESSPPVTAPEELTPASPRAAGSASAATPKTTDVDDPYASFTSPVGEQSGAGLPEESTRDRAYQAALTSSVVVGAARAQTSGSGVSDASTLATEEEQLVALGDSIMRAALRQTSPGGGQTGAAAPPNSDAVPAGRLGGTSGSFSTRAVDAAGSATIAQIEPAGSPYTLRAGTVIPGLLITGINSDLPGEIVGQVSRNVYDSRTQRIPLIPKGSRLIGTYDNQVAAGQGRLLVAWTRLILPDGRSMRLPGLALTDPTGQTGAKDKVDNHWRRIFGNALLLSAISAGVQRSQPPQTSVLSTPSAGQVAAGAVGQELSNVALEILRRGMDVAPTITIRAGQAFNVFLSGDLVLDAPYNPGG
jgi:type IV secretion system protein VirB10